MVAENSSLQTRILWCPELSIIGRKLSGQFRDKRTARSLSSSNPQKFTHGIYAAWEHVVQKKTSRRAHGGFAIKRQLGKKFRSICSRLLLVTWFAGAFTNSPLIATASDPVLNLAMVRMNHTERHVVYRETATTTLKDIKPMALNALPSVSYQFLLNDGTPSFKAAILEKRPAQAARNPLKLSHRTVPENTTSRLWASASIQAGYGEIYQDKTPSIYGHNGTGWQEPSCGYVKIHFRF